MTRQVSSKVSLDIRAKDDLDGRSLHFTEAWTVNPDVLCCPLQLVRVEWQHIADLNIANIEPFQVQLLIGLTSSD